jgi:ketosteroid isomerase-like protein
MRSATLCFAACLLATGAAPIAAQSGTSKTLFRLEDQWASALVKRDSGFFRRTLDADYVYSDERGVFGKDQVIAEQVGGTDTVSYAANEDMKAHVHGSTAVVTGILVVRGRGANGPFSHRYRFTDTWLRSKQRWLMIASQDYEVPAR